MRNATHELVGVSLAIMAGRAFEAAPPETAGLALTAILGSRLPDVDQLGSRIHRRTGFERRSRLVGAVGAVLRVPLLAFAALASHRALTHSALACAAATALAAVVASPLGTVVALVVGGGVAIGYVAHVVADACTPGGVRLWAPVSRRRVWLLPRRARISTGGWGEAALAASAVAAPVLVLLA